MSKCKICGKRRLFQRLNENGACKDCIRLADILIRTKKADAELTSLTKRNEDLKKQIATRKETIIKLREEKNEVVLSYKNAMIEEYDEEISNKQYQLNTILSTFNERESIIVNSEETIAKNEKSIENLKNKINRLKELYDAVAFAIDHSKELSAIALKVYEEEAKPTVSIHLHYMDVSELRKKYNENQKNIKELLQKFEGRYSTKANKTIYKIMVLALEAEIQNILADLKYGKLEDGKEQVIDMTRKYLQIASEGNQNIVGTMTTFIGSLESLYTKSLEIEYEYYTKKEKIKEEQRALREQMRQEAEERRKLAEQKAQMEREEGKFKTEIESLKASLEAANEEKRAHLEDRIKELESQLASVAEKKEEIVNLQNGKAGYVYVISNLGSFGEEVFKVGMTRRLDPQERVDELSCASVPFPFDVHTFIFSDDAVTLEHNLHIALNEKRVNKVNLRKEFFRIPLDEIEKLVLEYDPSAEFRRTMLAEQYRQSLSAGDSNFIYDIETELEDEQLDEDEL